MSLEKKKDNDLDQATNRPRSVEEAVGSHYALQVALQTMKERCQHLQQRLGVVEEENLSLRIESRKRKSDSSSTLKGNDIKIDSESTKAEIDNLEEKVTQLTRQKSQLTHHLFMVATENRQLWNRLSHLTQANQNLGNHLSKISNTLSRHNSASSITLSKSQSPTSSLTNKGDLNNSSDNILTKENNSAKRSSETGSRNIKDPSSPFTKTANDVAEESLEEISLKLIKSFLQEKTELEEQYAQMVEIQSDSSSYSIQNLGFGYLEDGDDTIEDVKQHYKNLLELRDMLKEQQTAMKAAITNLEKIKKAGLLCNSCQKSKTKPINSDVDIEVEMESLRKWGTPEATSYSDVIRRQLEQVAEPPQNTTPPPTAGIVTTPISNARKSSIKHEERICPMCGKYYGKGITFEKFQEHVSDHFNDDGDDDSYSIVNNFEVVT